MKVVNGAHILDVRDICNGVGFKDASASKKCESWQLTGETRNWRSVSWNWNFLSCCCSCQTWLYQILGFLFWDKPDFDCSCFIIMILDFVSNLPASSWSARTKKRAKESQSFMLKFFLAALADGPPHRRLVLPCPSSKFRLRQQVCHMWLQ